MPWLASVAPPMEVMTVNPETAQINRQHNPLIETRALIPIVMNLE
jgi:hypothetical protein